MRAHPRSAIATAALGLLIVADASGQAPAVSAVSATGMTSHAPAAFSANPARLESPAPATVGPGADGVTSQASWPELGPTIRGAAVGVRARVPASSSQSTVAGALLQEPNVGRSKALMIVGGAALVAGLLIGDDAGAVLAVGGAVVGLYGLYQYVR